MNCEHVEELLSAYLDDALAPEERRGVALHLQECAHCSSILADFRRFDALLSHMPPVVPDAALRDKIFSSTEYLELTLDASKTIDKQTVPYKRIQRASHPQLVALPGGRPSSSLSANTVAQRAFPQKRRGSWVQHVMQIMIAASILLTLGVGSFISWNLWKEQGRVTRDLNGITPPAGLQPGPISAGTHFVFLRDGALWSGPTDSGTIRLTPANVTVAANWVVKPPMPGRQAGDMLAYIDIRRGFVHILRSDGQNDTVLPQPLLKSGVKPSSVWDTGTGAVILGSLTWSQDGSMLAFVADSSGTGLPGLYIYSPGTGDVHPVPLPFQGAVSHPMWSPDGIRIAFEVVHNGNVGILDYNTQNKDLLTIASAVNTRTDISDTVLTLDWSPNVDAPAITWSVGAMGHVHSVWMQHVGLGSMAKAQALVTGDYAHATYSRAGHDRVGSWLLATSLTGHRGDARNAGDLLRVDLSFNSERLTSGKQVGFAQWSSDGKQIDYLNALSSGVGALHIVQVTTGNDTLVATHVAADPAPAWSIDGQHLAYSDETHIFVVDSRAIKTQEQLKLQGPASTFAWSATSPQQLLVAQSNRGQRQGIYQVNTQHNTLVQLDKEDTSGPILWTQIP